MPLAGGFPGPRQLKTVIYSDIKIYNLTEGTHYEYPSKLAKETYENRIQDELGTFELNDVNVGEEEIIKEWKFGDESTVYDIVLHDEDRSIILFRRCNVLFGVVAEDMDTVLMIAQDMDERLEEISVET